MLLSPDDATFVIITEYVPAAISKVVVHSCDIFKLSKKFLSFESDEDLNSAILNLDSSCWIMSFLLNDKYEQLFLEYLLFGCEVPISQPSYSSIAHLS